MTPHLIMILSVSYYLAHQWQAEYDCVYESKRVLSTTCGLLWRWREHLVRGALCMHKGWSFPWWCTEGRTSTPHKDSVCTAAGIHFYAVIRKLVLHEQKGWDRGRRVSLLFTYFSTGVQWWLLSLTTQGRTIQQLFVWCAGAIRESKSWVLLSVLLTRLLLGCSFLDTSIT